MRVARPPAGVKGVFELYTAPIKWVVNLGRLEYRELLPPHLLLNTKYGLYYTPVSNIHLLFQEVYEIESIMPKLVGKDTVFVDVEAHIGLYTV